MNYHDVQAILDNSNKEITKNIKIILAILN